MKSPIVTGSLFSAGKMPTTPEKRRRSKEKERNSVNFAQNPPKAARKKNILSFYLPGGAWYPAVMPAAVAGGIPNPG